MNLPNKITFARVFFIPFILVLFYLDRDRGEELNAYSIAIGVLFILASFTDFVDGYLARKHGIVTTFGKFLDPLADKLLVMAALLMLLDISFIPMWVVFVILARELIVTGLRLVVVGDGAVIAASRLGKYKTATTLVAIILLLFHVRFAGEIMLYIATALTVISGIEYIIKNIPAVASTK